MPPPTYTRWHIQHGTPPCTLPLRYCFPTCLLPLLATTPFFSPMPPSWDSVAHGCLPRWTYEQRSLPRSGTGISAACGTFRHLRKFADTGGLLSAAKTAAGGPTYLISPRSYAATLPMDTTVAGERRLRARRFRKKAAYVRASRPALPTSTAVASGRRGPSGLGGRAVAVTTLLWHRHTGSFNHYQDCLAVLPARPVTATAYRLDGTTGCVLSRGISLPHRLSANARAYTLRSRTGHTSLRRADCAGGWLTDGALDSGAAIPPLTLPHRLTNTVQHSISILRRRAQGGNTMDGEAASAAHWVRVSTLTSRTALYSGAAYSAAAYAFSPSRRPRAATFYTRHGIPYSLPLALHFHFLFHKTFAACAWRTCTTSAAHRSIWPFNARHLTIPTATLFFCGTARYGRPSDSAIRTSNTSSCRAAIGGSFSGHHSSATSRRTRGCCACAAAAALRAMPATTCAALAQAYLRTTAPDTAPYRHGERAHYRYMRHTLYLGAAGSTGSRWLPAGTPFSATRVYSRISFFRTARDAGCLAAAFFATQRAGIQALPHCSCDARYAWTRDLRRRAGHLPPTLHLSAFSPTHRFRLQRSNLFYPDPPGAQATPGAVRATATSRSIRRLFKR